VLTFTASGSVSDYADTSALQANVARLASVEASLVTIRVAAASVFITATIAVPASTTASAVQAALSDSLATAAGASDALGITVESTPTVTIAASEGGGGGGDDTAGIVGGAVGGGGALLLLLVAYCYKNRTPPQVGPHRSSSTLVKPNDLPLTAMISYTQQNDKASRLALALYVKLTEMKYKVWLDVKADDKSEAAMERAVKEAKFIIAIISDVYFERAFCLKELRWAKNAEKFIQPVNDSVVQGSHRGT